MAISPALAFLSAALSQKIKGLLPCSDKGRAIAPVLPGRSFF
jgi:hypothetical protein